MATKQEWLAYADEVSEYAKELKYWAKDLPDESAEALDDGPGSNPPTPPPPPPPPNA